MINIPFHLKLAKVTYHLMVQQELYGVLFDQEKARELVVRIDKEMKEIQDMVEPQLPKRPLNKTELNKYTPPKLQFKRDGTPSAATLKWFDDVDYHNDIHGDMYYFGWKNGEQYRLPFHSPIIKSLPMTLSNQTQIKDYLLSLGWKPTFYNLKKDAKGKPIRENGKVIRTTPKFSDNGKLCPNLEKLGDKAEIVKKITTWLSLRNRRSVLINEDRNSGWLNHPRLKADGRLPGGMSGLTNTHRIKHRTLVNVPRPGSLLGEEFRSLFIADEGMVIVGWDASGLEDKTKAHYTFKFDKGEYARKILDPEFDVHTENANLWGCERQAAKSPGYALQYNCSPNKFAETLGVSKELGQHYYDKYWSENWALRMAIEETEKEFDRNNGKFITLDVPKLEGHKIVTRSRHSVFNARCQGLGSKIMDIANWLVQSWIEKNDIPAHRLLFVHDEDQYLCTPSQAELLGQMGVKSIQRAGEILGLNVKLDGEYKISTTWAGTH